ncbi:MAG TPA: ABC transporter ATP-binding protein [Trinickia sp.]|nr:ABC transporter ATP-binding protein [Trinickia sp.]
MTFTTHELSLSHGTRPIVERLSVTLEAGRITALIGANGCGKSTLLRALAGLHAPQRGAVMLDGISLRDWPRKRLARRVAFLKQTQEVPEGLSVMELVRHGRYAHRSLLGGDTQADRDAVCWALDAAGLAALRNRPLAALSGGERQRAWIAMALAQRANILLLDEPTTYLDLGHQLEVMQTLAELNARLGLTIVMSLHDLNQALRYAQRALVLQNTRLVADGHPLDVLTPALIADVFHVGSERLNGAADGLPVCHASACATSARKEPRTSGNVLPLAKRASK